MTAVKTAREINVVVFMTFTISLFIHKREYHVCLNRIDLITKLSKIIRNTKIPFNTIP